MEQIILSFCELHQEDEIDALILLRKYQKHGKMHFVHKTDIHCIYVFNFHFFFFFSLKYS
jgi:hypothetical protein